MALGDLCGLQSSHHRGRGTIHGANQSVGQLAGDLDDGGPWVQETELAQTTLGTRGFAPQTMSKFGE